MAKRTVFITGTTGSMGKAGLTELLARRERFDLVTLVRPSAVNKKKMKHLEGEPGIRIVWGDLTSYEDVLNCVTGADVVLHPAAMISPAADHNPDAARAINVGSIQNILEAIKAQPDPDTIRLVNIGSVAMTGDRLYPIHVGRTGDPLKPSIYDAYACTKIDAEQLVAESGLKYWVSCRQTFIAVPDTLSLMDPIMFHQPLDTCIEFCTDKDSGLLLANACEDDVPEEFWQNFYNIGGGPAARLTFLELMERVYGALGLGSPEQLSDRNWYALRNFHCHWFEDSAKLNGFLNFQTMGTTEYVNSILSESPWYVLLPAKPGLRWLFSTAPIKSLLRRFLMKRLALQRPTGTMYWLENDLQDRISAFFKSRDTWKQIPQPWESIARPKFDEYQRLSHGYDESIPAQQWSITEMQAAAEFRGGRCASTHMEAGAITEKLRWQCWREHSFEMSPNTVLRGGHWCPECAPMQAGWNYDEEARHNPYFAQVWHTNHGDTEANYYSPNCYLDALPTR